MNAREVEAALRGALALAAHEPSAAMAIVDDVLAADLIDPVRQVAWDVSVMVALQADLADRLEDAERWSLLAIEGGPRCSWITLQNYGLVLQRLGRHREAVGALSEAFDRSPARDMPPILIARARSAIAAGLGDVAFADLDHWLGMAKQNPAARRRVLRMAVGAVGTLGASNRLASAMGWATELAAQEPDPEELEVIQRLGTVPGADTEAIQRLTL